MITQQLALSPQKQAESEAFDALVKAAREENILEGTWKLHEVPQARFSGDPKLFGVLRCYESYTYKDMLKNNAYKYDGINKCWYKEIKNIEELRSENSFLKTVYNV